jgi:hypothetical protein
MQFIRDLQFPTPPKRLDTNRKAAQIQKTRCKAMTLQEQQSTARHDDHDEERLSQAQQP